MCFLDIRVPEIVKTALRQINALHDRFELMLNRGMRKRVSEFIGEHKIHLIIPFRPILQSILILRLLLATQNINCRLRHNKIPDFPRFC